jgi:hypothetical protein
MISDTISSVASRGIRKRLEGYDSEKMALLYKVVLEDKGVGSILRLITKLNERAKKELDEEEKKKKRRMAIKEST